MTIARILQCDERTVRNRRDRACKVLKAVLQQEDVL
jgi:DNA-directed RNA polymerase specialized sigma24 family protein